MTRQILLTNMFFGILLLFVLPLSVQADDTNYCTDADAALGWNQLVKKHPADMEIHRLHALRLGLCEKVERGDVTVEQATKIFNHDWDALIEKRTHEEAHHTATEKEDS